MPDIKHREAKMQEARKNTPRREFVKEICSWTSLAFYNNNGCISTIHNSKRFNIIPREKFDSNREEYVTSLIYDNNQDFFSQYLALSQNTGYPSLIQAGSNENTKYADKTTYSKNVYLTNIAVKNSENILYSFHIKENVTNVFNSVMVWQHSTNVYFSTGVINSYNVFYSKYITSGESIWFSSNLTGCKECLFCANLMNQSFCINNVAYSEEDYYRQKKALLSKKSMFLGYFHNINTKGNTINSDNTHNSGFVVNSSNIENVYLSFNINKGRNAILMGGEHGNEDLLDAFIGGVISGKQLYGINSVGHNSERVYCSVAINNSSIIFYSNHLIDYSYCIGCIGLKNKQFCIFNKQYTKEERHEKANEIFAQMEKDGQLGKFFPASMNPFYFNDTVAYLIDESFTKEEVEAEGYLRRDEEIKVDIPEGSEVVYTSKDRKIKPRTTAGEISKDGKVKTLDDYQGFDADGNWHIDPEILKKVIVDETGNAYRIVKMEYDFLMKHGLPLPKLHWLERIKLGFQFK